MTIHKPLEAILLGAGNRGMYAYGSYGLTHPFELSFTAVAEPDPIRRGRFASRHDIPLKMQFNSWEEVFERPRRGGVVFNMTQDGMHYDSTVAALNAGYDVLLEKPMTNTLEETVELIKLAEEKGRLLQICHVLRYTKFFSTLNEIIRSGRLGDLITVEHRENVSFTHMAHSFVRGSWRSLAESSPMILAKCCHDLDLLYWNVGCPVEKLQSFGSLSHFRPENRPDGALSRCAEGEGCPVGRACQYDARKIYLDMEQSDWPVSTITADLSFEGRMRALKTGPYGRCVYACDNDVVDHQTVNMRFENGVTCTLTMHGHSHRESRSMRYDGARATLRGLFEYGQGRIEVHDHLSGEMELIEIDPGEGGHGGGDYGIVQSFIDAVRGTAPPLTTARESLESHLMAFAAEESRLSDTVIDMAAFREKTKLIN